MGVADFKFMGKLTPVAEKVYDPTVVALGFLSASRRNSFIIVIQNVECHEL